MEVLFVNQPPVAIASQDTNLVEGLEIQLDGNLSSDPDEQAITYHWVVPESLTFSDTSGAHPLFLAPQVNSDTTYSIVLFINDGDLNSVPDTVNVTVNNNAPPVANTGNDETVFQGEEVTLNGSGSHDPTDVSTVFGSLNYMWMAPSGIILSDNTFKRPTFTAPEVDDTTDFVFSLVVNDGEFDSDTSMVVITVTGNVAPEADFSYRTIKQSSVVVEGEEVTLDASGSSDSNNDECTQLTTQYQSTMHFHDITHLLSTIIYY